MPSPTAIHTVDESDLDDLLPLMRAYCDFYSASPPDDALLALSRALIAHPEREGVQLVARDHRGRAIAFATIFWTWSTTRAGRLAVMNDLYVGEHARGSGIADELIRECAARARAAGAVSLDWTTAKDNLRAQAVYDRVGGVRSEWLDYSLAL